MTVLETTDPVKVLDVEHWKNDNINITVEQTPGFWSSIKLIARVPLPPDEVFGILTDEGNARVFRSIKKKIVRRIVDDDGHGRLTVDTEQIGRWSWGPFRGTFSIHLLVRQDRNKRTIDFRLAPQRPGRCRFMKDFTGSWLIQPFDQDSIDEMLSNKKWNPFIHNAVKALHRFENRLTGHHRGSSLVELKQSVAPSVLPPGPIDGVLKKIAIAQVRTIMDDLLREAERINNEKRKKEKLLLGNGEYDSNNDVSNSDGNKSLLAYIKKF